MNWAALALALLRLALSVLEWTKRRNAITLAQQEQAVAQAAKLLELTEQGQRLRNRLAAMNDEDSLKLWDEMLKQ